MEELAAMAQVLNATGVRMAIEENVQFARARFGKYDTIDFVFLLFAYALNGEPTLIAFYDRLAPFTPEYLALFARKELPSRSALSRFLAALDEKTVEALRTQFARDLLERATSFPTPGGLWDRRGMQYVVIDVDGTRQVARQRALPTLPEPHRRFEPFSQSRLPGSQARRSGTDTYDDPADPHPSIDGHVWRTWQWGLSWRTDTCVPGCAQLCGQAPSRSLSDPHPSGWRIW